MASKFFASFFPKIQAQEEAVEEDLIDHQAVLREKCAQEPHCAHLYEIYQQCNDRVNSRTKTTETCAQELFDYIHALDHCVTPDLFSKLV